MPLTLLTVTTPVYKNNTSKGTLPLAFALKRPPRNIHEAMARFLESNHPAVEVITPPITHGLPKVNPIVFPVRCDLSFSHWLRAAQDSWE